MTTIAQQSLLGKVSKITPRSLVPKLHFVTEKCGEGPTKLTFISVDEVPAYNQLDVSFQKYLERSTKNSLPFLKYSNESIKFEPPQLDDTLPRTYAMQTALTLKQFLPKQIKVLTHRGDLVDIIMACMPHPRNSYDRINHIAYKKYGKVIIYHDALRDNAFKNKKARDGWYSGQKFESMCTDVEWPENYEDWTPSKPLLKRGPSVATLLEITFGEGSSVMVMAEFDCRDIHLEGMNSLVELKSISARMPKNFGNKKWADLNKEEFLQALINKHNFMKFFKTCLQSRFGGNKHIVFGARNNNTELVGVKRFELSEIEDYLKRQQYSKKYYYGYYLHGCDIVTNFLNIVLNTCEEGCFYKISKPNYNSGFVLTSIPDPANSLTFKKPFTKGFEKLLRKTYLGDEKPKVDRSPVENKDTEPKNKDTGPKNSQAINHLAKAFDESLSIV